MNKIQELINGKIQRFLESRNRPAHTPQKIKQALRSLDVFFWKQVNRVIQEKSPQIGEKIDLTPDEYLLVNAGVTNRRFSEETSTFFDTLFHEMTSFSSQNIYYFSEWLQHRWELDLAINDIEEKEETNNLPHLNYRDDPRYKIASEIRDDCVKKLEHLIKGLPGIPPTMMDMITSGKLMLHLEDILFNEISNNNLNNNESDKKLKNYFINICKRLQERCLIQQHQKIFKQWMQQEDHIYNLIKDNARDNQIEEKITQEKEDKESSSKANMLKNAKLVRSLIPLGVASSGLNLPFSPFFADINRCTKAFISRLMKIVREIDPFLPGDPDILIAPFCGNGFFEWDHNTLILPLTTEHSQNMALVNAVAGYRIMTDSLNFGGVLHKAWINKFGNENFKQRFVDAYHNWVLGIGYGRHHSMEIDEFNFFIDHIGPNPKRGIGPGHILKLDNEGQLKRLKECRILINKNEAQFEDIYDSAVIHWKRHNLRDALDLMERAFELNSDDARIHFSFAYLKYQHKRENVDKEYETIIKKHPRTLWKVYSEIQLDRPSL